jgi:hypothetical protein
MLTNNVSETNPTTSFLFSYYLHFKDNNKILERLGNYSFTSQFIEFEWKSDFCLILKQSFFPFNNAIFIFGPKSHHWLISWSSKLFSVPINYEVIEKYLYKLPECKWCILHIVWSYFIVVCNLGTHLTNIC